MKFPIGILALSLILSATTRLCAIPAEPLAPTSSATVLVWVRDSRGAPVAGLSAEDFVVSENGIQNRVIAVRSFVPAPGGGPSAGSTSGSKSGPGVNAPAAPDEVSSSRKPTQVLLILTPMGVQGRHDALRDAIRLLKKPVAADWRLGLIDDEGTFIPFGQSADQMRGILEGLDRRTSAPQYQPYFGGDWTPKAARAIRELGNLPGRRVIVCVSDYDSKSHESIEQNPTLLRVGPETFVGEAVNALAAMYTVEGNGPAVSVPFNGAASSDSYAMSGQNLANAMAQDLASLGAMRRDLLRAADETGGVAASSLDDAFKRIAGDAAGYYLVTFEARPNSQEGSLHPFSISTRLSQAKVRAPEFYLAPHEALAWPAEMEAALSMPANRTGLNVLSQAWLFPNQGSGHWAVFAADVRFQRSAPAPGSHVKIYAELVNNSMGGVAESWYEEREWPAAGEDLLLHWQREAYLYPGSYELCVTAMDAASGEAARAVDSFIARPRYVPTFRFGTIVLADGCLPHSGEQSARRNLFDPLRWDGCTLAPAAAGHFRASQSPLLLLRIYPPDSRLAEVVKQQWKAYAVVDDAADKAVELQISSAEIRGLAVTGKLRLESMNLAPGSHDLKVLFTMPGKNASPEVLQLHTKFSIDP